MKHFGIYAQVKEIDFGAFTLTGMECGTAKVRNCGGISAHDAIEEQLFDMLEELFHEETESPRFYLAENGEDFAVFSSLKSAKDYAEENGIERIEEITGLQWAW